MRMAGKSVLVTGAGKGIGRGIAMRIAEEGGEVAVADIDFALATQCSDDIVAKGGRSIAVAVDTADRAQVRGMIETLAGAFGKLDVAFNNAGVGHNSAFLDITTEQWDRMFSVNAKGVFLCIQEEARQMIAQGRGGKIVNTASIAGRHGSAYQAHYSASKFAVIGLTQSAAKALAPHQITVNAMNPGIIDTSMWQTTDRELAAIHAAESGKQYHPGEVTDEIRSQIPLSRVGLPEDVAALALFLASDDSDYMTGQAINVCGGLVMD
jgi:meso-butanediol dehydrogenase / (S,S)-butanediol dehydrogenase / diacetyl reductase